jgi:hypothetical protein
MSTCGAWPGRCPADAARLPTDIGPATVGHGWPYWALTGTAVAVVPVARRLDRRAYSRTRRGACPATTHVGSESMHRQLSAASPSEPRDRPSGSGVGVRFGCRARCRRDAAPLRSYGLESGPGGLARDLAATPATRGTSPSRQWDQVLVLPVRRLPGNRSASPPAPQRLPDALVTKPEAVSACRRTCSVALRTPTLSSSGRSPGRH